LHGKKYDSILITLAIGILALGGLVLIVVVNCCDLLYTLYLEAFNVYAKGADDAKGEKTETKEEDEKARDDIEEAAAAEVKPVEETPLEEAVTSNEDTNATEDKKTPEKADEPKRGTLPIIFLLVSILAALLLWGGVKLLRNNAKKTNRSIIEYKDLPEHQGVFSNDGSPIYNNTVSYTFLDNIFEKIFYAINNDRSNRDVTEMSNYIDIPKDYVQNLNYNKMSDYLLYLYSHNYVNDVRLGEEVLINKDSKSEIDNLLREYRNGAIDDFKNGNYYSASAKVNEYFSLYEKRSSFPIAGVDNKIHMLNILLEYKWALTTHRKFAEAAISCIEKDRYRSLANLCGGDKDLENVSRYFEGVAALDEDRYSVAQAVFCDIIERTTNKTLKQYCMLMAIRCAFWHYDTQSTLENYNSFKSLCKKYESQITLPFFDPDIERYKEAVEDKHRDSNRD
jgi:hypothetical protein